MHDDEPCTASLFNLSLIALLLLYIYVYVSVYIRRASRCMCWDGNSGSWRVWGKTGRRRHFGYFGGGELETTDLGSGTGVHSSVYPYCYSFRSLGVGVLLALGGYELAQV
jgi:hypothetical protein